MLICKATNIAMISRTLLFLVKYNIRYLIKLKTLETWLTGVKIQMSEEKLGAKKEKKRKMNFAWLSTVQRLTS